MSGGKRIVGNTAIAEAVETAKMPAAPREAFLGLVPVDARLELTKATWLRSLLRSRWTTFVPTALNLFLFLVILAAGVVGTPVGNANIAIVFIWILWWSALMLVLVPFASRLWCGMCPLPVLGEWVQRFSIVKRRWHRPLGLSLKWPKKLRSMWLVNVVFLGVAAFSGIITTRPWATVALLGSIMILGTALFLVYERRTFCRYLCPVGGFLGLYANFAAIEIRPRSQPVCVGHKSKECILGSMAGHGCPWLEQPTSLKRNTYCGLCFECFRCCSHDNMGLFARPFGTDLLVDSHRGLDESWKAFIMLGAAGVYSATMMGPWGTLKDMANLRSLGGWALFAGGLIALLAGVLPAVHGATAWLSWRLAGRTVPFRRVFTNFTYHLVPIGLLAWIGFSFAILLPNGSYVIRIISDPFGWGWNLFGTAHFAWTPVLTSWMPALQAAALLFGFVYSVDVARKIARQTFPAPAAAARAVLPQIVLLAGITAAFLWLFVG
ncbi:MAG TPA: 4Fe-4S binding protein [bacterium]|nr:4Fe-4S binding protein [bacterium]